MEIPDELNKKYNSSLTQIDDSYNLLVGYEKEKDLLDSSLYNVNTPSAIIVGEPGVGKTSLVKQLAHDRYQGKRPLVVVDLNIEKLGELNDNVFVSRCREILSDMNIIKEYTAEQNGIDNNSFQMALFIDEMHKLNNYGKAHVGEKGSSGAMNALKNDLAAGIFPVIGATTDYEFENNIKPDKAFSRRLTKIIMREPPKKIIMGVAKKWLESKRKQLDFVPTCDNQTLSDLIDYANAYVRDSAQPARTLAMLDKCVGLCRKRVLNVPEGVHEVSGLRITQDIIIEAFKIEGHDINTDMRTVNLVIPPEIDEKYNHSLTKMEAGKNTLIGYREQIDMLEACLYRISERNSLLLGPAGVGKTALVEQEIYNRTQMGYPLCVISLSIEKLGELPENIVIGRMRSLQSDLREIERVTKEANPGKNFQLALFIDEIHKLNNYGTADSKEGSSAAMNALKEGLARDAFPVIGATTDYEYRRDILSDTAFDRRFGKVIMEEPNQDAVIKILQRRLDSYRETEENIPECDERELKEIIMYTDAFIRNMVNPAKSLSILNSCVGFCRKNGKDKIDHEVIREAFLAEGYTIDTTTDPNHIIEVVNKRVVGQPLALENLADVVRNSLYVKRDFKKPLMTAFFVGSTGVGKTETAKALAEAFFGRRDAIITLNGGDYATPEDAIKAQHFVGDSMQTDKRKIILLDEIEKSDSQVMDAYMRMIDEGIARDSHNIERSLNSTVIIATSNLGADIFSQLKETLKLDNQSDPNKFTQDLADEWWRRKESVTNGLRSGNVGRNDGIKAEFLERFSILIPFLPLAKKTIAMIARMQLENFVEEMKASVYHPITIQLPKKEPYEYWVKQMYTPNTVYADCDPLSVMIAEDVVGKEANQHGAREIAGYINNTVKTDVIKALDYRLTHNLSIDGAFRLSIKHASFFDNDKDVSGVKVDYINKEDL